MCEYMVLGVGVFLSVLSSVSSLSVRYYIGVSEGMCENDRMCVRVDTLMVSGRAGGRVGTPSPSLPNPKPYSRNGQGICI